MLCEALASSRVAASSQIAPSHHSPALIVTFINHKGNSRALVQMLQDHKTATCLILPCLWCVCSVLLLWFFFPEEVCEIWAWGHLLVMWRHYQPLPHHSVGTWSITGSTWQQLPYLETCLLFGILLTNNKASNWTGRGIQPPNLREPWFSSTKCLKQLFVLITPSRLGPSSWPNC